MGLYLESGGAWGILDESDHNLDLEELMIRIPPAPPPQPLPQVDGGASDPASLSPSSGDASPPHLPRGTPSAASIHSEPSEASLDLEGEYLDDELHDPAVTTTGIPTAPNPHVQRIVPTPLSSSGDRLASLIDTLDLETVIKPGRVYYLPPPALVRQALGFSQPNLPQQPNPVHPGRRRRRRVFTSVRHLLRRLNPFQ